MTRVPVRWPARIEESPSFRPAAAGAPVEENPLAKWLARTEKALGVVLDDPDEVSRLDFRVVLDANDIPWITVATPVAPGLHPPEYFLPLRLLEEALPEVTPDGFDGLEKLLHRLVFATPREEIEEAFPGVRKCSEDARTLAHGVFEPLIEEVWNKVFRELVQRMARGAHWDNRRGDQMALAALTRMWMLDAMHELLKRERPRWFKAPAPSEVSKHKPSKTRKHKSNKRRK